MTQTIDTRPDRVDVAAYAGDSLQFRVLFVDYVPDQNAAYRAHVKDQYDTPPLATFDATPIPDRGVTLTLTPEQTEELGKMAYNRARAACSPGRSLTEEDVQFVGVWDVEVVEVNMGTRTLASGSFTLQPDVTDVDPVR